MVELVIFLGLVYLCVSAGILLAICRTAANADPAAVLAESEAETAPSQELPLETVTMSEQPQG